MAPEQRIWQRRGGPRCRRLTGENIWHHRQWWSQSSFQDVGPRGTMRPMAEWIYFIHPPRDDFADTMTDEEVAVWGVHFERFRRLLAEGTIILVGPTLGHKNTGIAIFEAPDEASARRIMEEDPVIAGGFARGELRPFRVSLMRGRDG